MSENDASPLGQGEGAGSGKPAAGSARAKTGVRGKHFLSAREREVLRAGPEFVQKTKRQYDSRRIDRERRDHASRYARAKRKAQADARAALEDLAFLAETMDPAWLYDLATHVQPPRGVPLDAARAFAIPAVLPRILEALSAKVGEQRAPEIVPMTDPDPKDWPAGYEQTGTVVLQATGTQLVAVWLAAVEVGLNASERGRQQHLVTHSIRAPPPPPMPSPQERPRRRKARQ